MTHSRTTDSRMTKSIMTLNGMSNCRTTIRRMTYSRTTLSRMTNSTMAIRRYTTLQNGTLSSMTHSRTTYSRITKSIMTLRGMTIYRTTIRRKTFSRITSISPLAEWYSFKRNKAECHSAKYFHIHSVIYCQALCTALLFCPMSFCCSTFDKMSLRQFETIFMQ